MKYVIIKTILLCKSFGRILCFVKQKRMFSMLIRVACQISNIKASPTTLNISFNDLFKFYNTMSHFFA